MGRGKYHPRKSLIALLAVLALIAAACSSTAQDEPGGTTNPTTAATTTTASATGLDAICEIGAQEGSMVYWASTEVDNFARLIEPFDARYPGIAIEYLTIRPEDVTQRILTSVAAGQGIEPDLIYGSPNKLSPLVERGLVDSAYDWSRVGIDPAKIDESNMIRLFVFGLGIAYNTDNVKPEDLPSTWEELIDSKYADSVVMDPRGNPFDVLALEWGEDVAADYVTRLKATINPIIIKGGTAGMTEVLAGGALMTTSGRSDALGELQSEGAPIEMHYMEDVVPVGANYNALTLDAKSPNAAACFAGWLASPEGADTFRAVEFKINEFPPAGVPAGAKVVSVTSAKDAAAAQAAGVTVAEILAP